MKTLDEGHSYRKLIKAALDVFSEEGFHGATTKKISERAQVNESLISRHFNSKQGLFLSVLDDYVENRKNTFNYPLQENVELELIAFSDQIIDYNLQNAKFIKIVLSHALQSSEFSEQIRGHLLNTPKIFLTERLEQVSRKEGLKKFDFKMVESITHKITHTGCLYSIFLKFQSVEESRKGIHKEIRFFWSGIRETLVE